MASKTYKTHALILKKTKLSEKDLIVTLLDESGALLKCIAKGARKPGGSLAAKVELFSSIDALVAQGRNLDILSDVRIDTSQGIATFDLDQAACASPVAELVEIVAQEGLEQARLYDMTLASFSHIREASPDAAVTICAASMWKVMAQVGFKPRFDSCALCGNAIDAAPGSTVLFSVLEGGVLCGECAHNPDAIRVERETVAWSNYLMHARFDEIEDEKRDLNALFSSLTLARQWIRTHTNRDVKSLNFLLTAGIM